MAGGLINIVSFGSTDLYLSGAPQITFFKIVYRRYTNFSMESVQVNFDDNLDFGVSSDIPLPRVGDAFSKIYLEILLPQVSIGRADLGLNPIDVSSLLTASNNALNDYNTVLSFMQINASAYRVSTDDYNAQNVNNVTWMNDIVAVFNGTNSGAIYTGAQIAQFVADYNGVLPNITDTTLSSRPSSLYDFALANLDYNSTYLNAIPKSTLMNEINLLIGTSTKIQGYFFNTYMTALETYNSANTQNIKFAWVNRLGHSIIDYMEVLIGGQTIDKHYGQWLDVFYELAGNRRMDQVYFKMIGNVNELKTFDNSVKPSYKLVIPLQFWFCRGYGLAFPLIAMQYSDIVLRVKLRDLNLCSYIENLSSEISEVTIKDIWDNKGLLIQCDLLVDYIYFDALERKKFAQCAHEYLITAIQTQIETNITSNANPIQLDFSHPCREFIWITQKDAYTQNDTGYTVCNWSNYSTSVSGAGNPINTAEIDMNGYVVLDPTVGLPDYLNYVQPLAHHRNTPADGINVYSFSFSPEEHQPSGSVNISRLLVTLLSLTYMDSLFTYQLSDIHPEIVAGSGEDATQSTTGTLTIFAVTNNVLRLIGGYGALAFTFS